MRRFVLVSVLPIFIFFSLYTGISQEMKHFPLDFADEQINATPDTISDSYVVIETVRTFIQKPQLELHSLPEKASIYLRGIIFSFGSINYIPLPVYIANFLYAVYYQSNYLSF